MPRARTPKPYFGVRAKQKTILKPIQAEDIKTGTFGLSNAKNVGDYYLKQLNILKKEFSCIGDVRGAGLFLGIEIVEKNSKKPNTVLAQKLKNELRKKYILVGSDGPFNNVIKTKPPICFTKKNVDTVCLEIRKILDK